MWKKHLMRLIALFFIGTMLHDIGYWLTAGTAAGETLGIVVGAAAGTSAGVAQDEVYLTVRSPAAARIHWPEYPYSGYSYILQVKIDESGFEQVAEFSRTITEYDFNGVKAPSVYIFRIMLREIKSGRETEYYNEIIYKSSGSLLMPTTPSLVQISPAETRISWAYSEGVAYETEISRRCDGETEYSLVAVAAAGVNMYIDDAVSANTLYRYRIRAKYGYAVYSEYMEASVRSAIDTPQIIEIYAASPSSVYIAWTASSDAARYRLERRPKNELEFASVATIANERTYYTDAGIIPGDRYYYRVMAVSQNGAESLYSDEVEVCAAYIDISQTISAIATADYRIELAWADLGNKESTYEIWRSDEQFPGWKLLETTELNATSYIDARVGPGEGYIYRIRARSVDYDSVSRFSAEARAATIFSAAPTELRQTNAGSTGGAGGNMINLSWRDNSADESGFYIERRSGYTGRWFLVASTGANVVEKSGLSAPASSAWYFRVGAYSPAHNSIAYSDPILVDNGYAVTIRGSSYQTDGNIESAGAGAGAGSGAGGTGAGADIGDIQLDSKVIRELTKLKIVEANNGRIVGGDDLITRGEFVAMLARALGAGEKALGSFDDVKLGHPYYTEIMQAARLGFAKPISGNLFYPDRIITRAEMIIFVFDSLLANGTPLQPHGASALRPFPDKDEVPPPMLEKTYSVFGERIMIGIGMPSGRIIGADRESTREQAALVIYRYIKWLGAHPV